MRARRGSAALLAAFASGVAQPEPARAQPAEAPSAEARPASGGLSTGRRRQQVMQERRVVGRTSSLETKATERAQAQRQDQVALQIPAALRQRALQRIERRIGRNLQQARALRREALGMLGKLLGELPPDASEMPTTLMRLGELEWEEAREAFLAEFARWESTPSDQRNDPPVPNYASPRARFARVLEQYPSFERYDLALY